MNFAESLRIALKQGYYKKRFLELNFEDPATEERESGRTETAG